MSKILETNELNNAIDYLEKASEFHKNKEDNYWFKWTIISLYGALYNFGICAIKGVYWDITTLKKIKEKKINERKQDKLLELKSEGFDTKDIEDTDFLDYEVRYQNAELIGIGEVIRRCKKEEYMNLRLHSKVLELTPSQDKAIARLIEYRNDFSHFKPTVQYTISKHDTLFIKEIAIIIKFLALESGNVLERDNKAFKKVSNLITTFL